jgi:hypothetical protein
MADPPKPYGRRRARLSAMQRRAAMGISMILVQNVIHQTYFVLSALVAVLLVSRLFRRKTRPGLAYDIVYAYAIIPFILRALHIK